MIDILIKNHLELARLLPNPLYVMYSQCVSYSQACDTRLEVRVVGEATEARRIQEMENREEEEDMDEDNGKDESQDPDVDGDKIKRSKSRVDSKSKTLQMHPLQVWCCMILHPNPKQAEKLKSREMKDFANRRKDICECRVAFVTEKWLIL